MTKSSFHQNLISLIVLLLLSLITAFVASFQLEISLKHSLLILIAVVKIMLVAGLFMELHLAHRFWFFALFALIALIGISILIMA